VTLAAHVLARRGRQLEPVLGNGPGHPPPHARPAHHGAPWPPCRRCPPPSGLPHPPQRRKPALLTRCPTLKRCDHRADAPAAAVKTHLAGRAWHEDGLPLAGLTIRFSCGPASVTLAAHVLARRGRQLEPVLGAGPGHPPPHARPAHHGAPWPPCRRCPPPSGLPHPPQRRKPALLTRCPTLKRCDHRADAPAAAVKTHLAGRAWHEDGLPLAGLTKNVTCACGQITLATHDPTAAGVRWTWC
jgi:hypothetical protein